METTWADLPRAGQLYGRQRHGPASFALQPLQVAAQQPNAGYDVDGRERLT
jgi:hypothetical protein